MITREEFTNLSTDEILDCISQLEEERNDWEYKALETQRYANGLVSQLDKIREILKWKDNSNGDYDKSKLSAIKEVLDKWNHY